MARHSADVNRGRKNTKKTKNKTKDKKKSKIKNKNNDNGKAVKRESSREKDHQKGENDDESVKFRSESNPLNGRSVDGHLQCKRIEYPFALCGLYLVLRTQPLQRVQETRFCGHVSVTCPRSGHTMKDPSGR